VQIHLALRSSVFNAMLRSNMKENKENSINMNTLNSKQLSAFLQFLYTGNTNFGSALSTTDDGVALMQVRSLHLTPSCRCQSGTD
jgi:hypothetical protein